MKSLSILIITFMIIFVRQSYAQNIKFGKVSKQELAEKYYPLDSSANAAILYKKRRTYYDYSDSEGFTLVTEVHERIKIYNKDGVDWATKYVNLYNSRGSDEQVLGLKANTYNLENNKLQVTKLKKNGIFKENINEHWSRKKFTLPNIKKGSIVEWKYKIFSPFIWNINDVIFQYSIPVKHIAVKIEIPEYYVFKNKIQGFYPIKLEKTKKASSVILNSKSRNYDSNGVTTTSFQQDKINLVTNIISCELKNIPSIEKEPYVNNLDNYKAILKFEHTATKYPNAIPKFYNTTWEDVTKTIYKNPNFGEQLKKSSYFKEDLQGIVNITAPLSEKISRIFQFVKSKVKWDGFYGKYTSKGVRKAYTEGVGNVAEVNLILVAMLRETGVHANPILVSTREHGIPLFPTSDGFNYVIAGIELDNGGTLLLDATEIYSLPNVLPLRDLNWRGRIVRRNGSSTSISLFPRNPTKETCFINTEIDNEGNLKGIERISYNKLQALQARKKYNRLAENDMVTLLEKNNDNIEINQLKILNEMNIGKPLVYQFDFEADNQTESIADKMYFLPLLFLAKDENPFKLEDRKFPVDFGAPWENKYTISIKIPKDYTIESKPENVAYSLPDNLGSYKFLIEIKDTNIRVLSNIKINSPIISPVYYASLKEFYKKVIDKQLEKVVLAKK